MRMSIKQISYVEAKKFASEKWLTIKPYYYYIALVDETESLLSMMALEKGKNAIKIHACSTPKERRGCGYFSMLLSHILPVLEGERLIADATQYSKGIFEKMGFKQTRTPVQRKHFVITRMELQYGKDGQTKNRDRL